MQLLTTSLFFKKFYLDLIPQTNVSCFYPHRTLHLSSRYNERWLDGQHPFSQLCLIVKHHSPPHLLLTNTPSTHYTFPSKSKLEHPSCTTFVSKDLPDTTSLTIIPAVLFSLQRTNTTVIWLSKSPRSTNSETSTRSSLLLRSPSLTQLTIILQSFSPDSELLLLLSKYDLHIIRHKVMTLLLNC